MKKVCIVQAGPFLLGIDSGNTIARYSWSETSAQVKKEQKIFQLDALLSRQIAHTVPDESICLELRSEQESVFVVADQIVADDVEIINPPNSLPASCPVLTAQLFPQMLIWEEKPVLLLEPAQLLPVAAKLGENIGLLTTIEKDNAENKPVLLLEPAQLFPVAAELGENIGLLTTTIEQDKAENELTSEPEAELESDTEEDDPFFPVEEETTPEEVQDKIPEPKETPLFFMEDAIAEVAAESVVDEAKQADPQETQKKDSSSVDEETFKRVMSWTISRFKQSSSGEELQLRTDQLPPELASMVERKGLDKNVIEYLMEQIVLRCKESIHRKKTTGGK